MPAPKEPVSREAGRIRRMFADISPRYDLLNHVLSLNLDRGWRRSAVRALELRPGSRVLDLCTGTGDLALEIRRVLEDGLVVGADFTPEMVRIADGKRRRAGAGSMRLLVADALDLPFEDGVFDGVAAAFGIRNLQDLDRGLDEIRRVLRPGGRAVILEFAARRGGIIDGAFRFYFHHLLPRLGGWISGSREGKDAYTYLPASVLDFPPPEDLARRMSSRGFTGVRHETLTLGIVSIHVGSRAPGLGDGLEPAAAGAGARRGEAP